MAYPKLSVDRGVYRLRVLNGSNARFYNLSLKGGTGTAVMYQAGTDGGLLNAPVRLNALLLAPGERADVLIDFRTSVSGDKITLSNNAPAPYPTGPRATRRGGIPLPDLMQFQVGAGTAAGSVPTATPARPAPLRPNNPLPAITKTGAARNIMLNEILDPTSGAPLRALMNNAYSMAHQLPDGRPGADGSIPARSGTVEQWNIINTTADTHPIHTHLAQFRLLDRQKFNASNYLSAVNATIAKIKPGAALPNPQAAGLGPVPALQADPYTTGGLKAPAAAEAGWKDTVRANPSEVTRILVQFGAGAKAPYDTVLNGSYIFHCHILEHEENDLMLPLNVG